MIEDTFAEIDAYSVPEKDADRFKRIREKADLFDYDGILSILDE